MREHEQRFLASEVPPQSAEKAFFHVISAPLEMSVSYGHGAALGPEAILEASDQLELWDGEGFPGQAGIFTHPPLNCSGTAQDALARIEAAVAESLALGACPVLLGGEHTVSYGALAAMKKRYGSVGVVQFDAHADLRDEYSGTPFSHASVMRRAVADLGLPLIQLGNRAMCYEEVEARRKHGVIAWDAAAIARVPLNDLAPALAAMIPADFPPQVYISFDVDGLDASLMPATGTPVPGGLGWYEALELAEAALAGRRLVGFDVVELAPLPGQDAWNFTAARLVYALMGLALRHRHTL